MAPDLNSVPPSPRPPASSRGTSQQMAAPPQPVSPSLNILPSNQNAVNQTSPPLASPGLSVITGSGGTQGDNTGVGIGPGPLRHPRPLTAAELHLQLEKEQEAVVNRLTRELSILRAAQNASVASNTSSTSASFPDPADHNSNHLLSGPSHPAPSQRHHRSSSSTSVRSITAASSGGTAGVMGNVTSGIVSATTDRNRAGMNRHDSNPQNPYAISRQNSVSSRRSGANSPAPGEYRPSTSRPSMIYHEPSTSTLSVTGSNTEMTSARFEEAVLHRNELDAVKRENEALRRRIRDLERTLRDRRQSDASRTRSESVSTTASVNPGLRRRGDSSVSVTARGREHDKGGDDDVVRVGESARSAGLR
ncbi:MAG: hypothetical protein M1818_000420 [Claussenomyces sp. TS43310]|nr:MAG: hypothetical protein M1818_000420 [Claussenomyces sp. TS43310]